MILHAFVFSTSSAPPYKILVPNIIVLDLPVIFPVLYIPDFPFLLRLIVSLIIPGYQHG
jgi:hypothetical protein